MKTTLSNSTEQSRPYESKYEIALRRWPTSKASGKTNYDKCAGTIEPRI